jgi:hypothetical protein
MKISHQHHSSSCCKEGSVHPIKINSERCAACNILEVAISKLVSVCEPSVEGCVWMWVRACAHPCTLMRDREDVVWGRTLTHLDFKGDEPFQCANYRALPAVWGRNKLILIKVLYLKEIYVNLYCMWEKMLKIRDFRPLSKMFSSRIN